MLNITQWVGTDTTKKIYQEYPASTRIFYYTRQKCVPGGRLVRLKSSTASKRPTLYPRQRRTHLIQLPVAPAQFDDEHSAMFADGPRASGGNADDSAVENQHPQQRQRQNEEHGRH